MKRLLLLAALLLVPAIALSQTAPYSTFTTESTGTIAVTNTAQAVFSKAGFGSARIGCLIQNQGTAAMYVYFGDAAPAVGAAWFVIQPPQTSPVIQGGTISCAVGGTAVAADKVWIAGTATDTFTYAIQGQSP